MKSLKIDFDRDYGVDNRTGWSIAIDGRFAVSFERWLIVALWKAWRNR